MDTIELLRPARVVPIQPAEGGSEDGEQAEARVRVQQQDDDVDE